jgi:chemotaxis protein histidine kinase CheA
MTPPNGLVDFFVLEASDYAERLDAAIATGGLRGPDPEALARYGRALRGTATMSRFPAIAQLAGAIERVGRAMHSGRLPWSPALAGAITSGVDEVKLLVRAAREWTPAHEERAAARTTELLEYVPAAAAAAAPIAGNAAAYLGGEVAAIATGLMAYLTTGGNEGALALVLRRARAVLGVATAKDAPPVADVVGAVERTAAALEARPASARSTGAPAATELFSAAAVVLQRAATDLRAGRAPDVAAPDLERFERGPRERRQRWSRRGDRADQRVPRGHADQAVVRAAPNPPMTARARFRAEMVGHAEHLRRLVGEARAAVDLVGRARVAHELERTLRTLERTAASFGETAAAAYFARMADRARALEPQALAEIDAAGATSLGRVAPPRPACRRAGTLGGQLPATRRPPRRARASRPRGPRETAPPAATPRARPRRPQRRLHPRPVQRRVGPDRAGARPRAARRPHARSGRVAGASGSRTCRRGSTDWGSSARLRSARRRRGDVAGRYSRCDPRSRVAPRSRGPATSATRCAAAARQRPAPRRAVRRARRIGAAAASRRSPPTRGARARGRAARRVLVRHCGGRASSRRRMVNLFLRVVAREASGYHRSRRCSSASRSATTLRCARPRPAQPSTAARRRWVRGPQLAWRAAVGRSRGTRRLAGGLRDARLTSASGWRRARR